MRHAIIMAGGAGVRLWPLSRQRRPKQVLRLFGGTSLLRQSFDRVARVLPPAQIYIITNQAHVGIAAEELPELPPENVIGEPVGRDTAATVGLGAAIIAERDRDAVIGMFTADHIITPLDRFATIVRRAYELAESHADSLVTMGIRPSRPETSYGYVCRGERLSEGVFAVECFTEKPTVAKAIEYLGCGSYYWNSGMFAWRAATILVELRKHLPQTHTAVTEIAAAWGTPQRQATLDRVFPGLMKISIDFAVMERAERVLVVEMDCHWVDVGSWPAIESVIAADGDGNVAACEHVVHLGSRGNVVVSEEKHLIATIGVDDLVIVHSPDATLVCKKRDAQGIKELADMVRGKFGDVYQ